MNGLEPLVRDAGPLDVEEEAFGLELEFDSGRRHEACLDDPWLTATTAFACD